MVGNTLLTHTKRAKPPSASEMKRFIRSYENAEMVDLLTKRIACKSGFLS